MSVIAQLFESCPRCKYPYASSFDGCKFVMSGQPVCGGSSVLNMCLPTVYLCFQVPLSSMMVEAVKDGKRYRGVVYAVQEQERIDDDG